MHTHALSEHSLPAIASIPGIRAMELSSDPNTDRAVEVPGRLSRFGAKLRDVFTAPIPRASHPPAALCADPVDRYWFSSLLIPVWLSAVTGYKPHYREGGRVCQDILS